MALIVSKVAENRGGYFIKPSIQRSSFLVILQAQNDTMVGKHALEGVHF